MKLELDFLNEKKLTHEFNTHKSIIITVTTITPCCIEKLVLVTATNMEQVVTTIFLFLILMQIIHYTLFLQLLISQ